MPKILSISLSGKPGTFSCKKIITGFIFTIFILGQTGCGSPLCVSITIHSKNRICRWFSLSLFVSIYAVYREKISSLHTTYNHCYNHSVRTMNAGAVSPACPLRLPKVEWSGQGLPATNNCKESLPPSQKTGMRQHFRL